MICGVYLYPTKTGRQTNNFLLIAKPISKTVEKNLKYWKTENNLKWQFYT